MSINKSRDFPCDHNQDESGTCFTINPDYPRDVPYNFFFECPGYDEKGYDKWVQELYEAASRFDQEIFETFPTSESVAQMTLSGLLMRIENRRNT